MNFKNIKVGKFTLVYCDKHNGWILPGAAKWSKLKREWVIPPNDIIRDWQEAIVIATRINTTMTNRRLELVK